MIVLGMGGSVSAASTDGKKSSGNPALRKLAINMIYFAVVSLICICVQVEAVAKFLPQAAVFGSKISAFVTCASAGIPTQYWVNGKVIPGGNQHVFTETDLNTTQHKCGNFVDFAPPASTLQLLLLSQSMPIFLFGFLFALPALKQLHQQAKTKMSRVGTSGASAASSSG